MTTLTSIILLNQTEREMKTLPRKARSLAVNFGLKAETNLRIYPIQKKEKIHALTQTP